MAKKKKKTGGRHGLQIITLCISTTLVLILLGLMVFSMLTAHNLSTYVKENLVVSALLDDSLSVNDAHLLCRDLYHRPYSRHIDYVSKADASREQVAAMGSDPSEFLGFNPFSALLACAALGGGIYALFEYEPAMQTFITWEDMAIVGAAVFVFGLVITLLCTYFSVNKFLRMKAGELYKI